MAEVVEGRVDGRRHGELPLICIVSLCVIHGLDTINIHFVNDDCVGNKLYLPVATSISNLIKKTVEALEVEHAPLTLEQARIEVPGVMWVSMQFCPKNQLSTRAHSYTGKLNLMYKVHQRTLRAYSVDSHYVAAACKYVRSFGLWLHKLLENANNDVSITSASCDDKCKGMTTPTMCLYVGFISYTSWCSQLELIYLPLFVSIGEPSLPIQLAQRGKASIVPSGCEIVAGDHDFHVCNLTPSVTLITEIKAHPEGNGGLPSLYKCDFVLILHCRMLHNITQ
jgi:hypothetical protein